MNGTSHLKYMLLGGAGLFGILVLLGYPLQSAVLLAIALACPLMMVFMMAGGHGGHASAHTDHREAEGESTDRTFPPSSAPHHH